MRRTNFQTAYRSVTTDKSSLKWLKRGSKQVKLKFETQFS